MELDAIDVVEIFEEHHRHPGLELDLTVKLIVKVLPNLNTVTTARTTPSPSGSSTSTSASTSTRPSSS
ncbi:hypothetical protein V8E36_000282 [Tilletia maclaganii]